METIALSGVFRNRNYDAGCEHYCVPCGNLMVLHEYLIGGPMEGEKIHEAEQVSWIDHRITIFDLLQT